MAEADTGAALNADPSLSSTTPNRGSNIHVSSSHAADDSSSHPTDTQGASSVVLPESSPANSTLVTSPSDNRPPSDPKFPPQLLVVVRKFKESLRDPEMGHLEEEKRLVFMRDRVEKMTYSEASEYIKDKSGLRTYGAPGNLRATFMQAGLDEDVKPSYIMEEDWSFLIRRASALYMDFQRTRAWYYSLLDEDRNESRNRWGQV